MHLNCAGSTAELRPREASLTPLRTNASTRRLHGGIALVFGLFGAALPAQAGDDGPPADGIVFHAFPEADSYRRIVRDVDQQARTTIERQLPFKVHFDELGAHTLFVAFRGRQPIGFIYLRSEEAEWGLAEIAWSMTLDLHVLGFQFLRGRGLHQRELESSAFAKQLVGCDRTRLEALLAGKAQADALVPQRAAELAATVLRSGAKALLVTDTVWPEEIAKLQDLGRGFDSFPSAERFLRKVVQLDLQVGDAKQTVAANIVRAIGKGNTPLGAVVRSQARIGNGDLLLRWVIDGDLRIMHIVPVRSWASDELRLLCKELEGHRLVDLPAGDNRLLPIARGLGEVLLRLNTTKVTR